MDGFSILIKDGNEQYFIYKKNREKKEVIMIDDEEKITYSDEYKKLQMFYKNIKNRNI